MDYRTFVEKIREKIQEHLGKDYEVQITTNPKFNGTEKTGLFYQKNAGTAASDAQYLFGGNVLRDIYKRKNFQNVWKKSV